MLQTPFGAGNQQSPPPPQITGLFPCKCGNQVFDQKLLVGIISAIVSPTGKDEYIPLPALMCMACGKLYNPQEMREFGEQQEQEEKPGNIVKLH